MLKPEDFFFVCILKYSHQWAEITFIIYEFVFSKRNNSLMFKMILNGTDTQSRISIFDLMGVLLPVKLFNLVSIYYIRSFKSFFFKKILIIKALSAYGKEFKIYRSACEFCLPGYSWSSRIINNDFISILLDSFWMVSIHL